MALKPTVWSFAIQATGSAATLGAALLVTWRLGLVAQGEFGLLRSWNDALVSAAVFGLPQSLLHLQYREGVPIAALRGWALRYVAVLAGVLVVAAVVAVHGGAWHRAPAFDDTTLLVLAASVPLAAAHQLYRSLLLRGLGAVGFAWITALPSLLIFAGLLPICLGLVGARFVWTLLLSALLSAWVASWLVWRAPRPASDASEVAWSRRLLWRVGLETGAQAVLTALAPALVLSTARLLGAPLAQVGMVSLALQVYSLFGVAAMYVAPLVYDRAARRDRPLGVREVFARVFAAVWRLADARALAVVALGTALALTLAAHHWPAAAPSPWLLCVMALAGVFSTGVRLLTTLMLARGAFRPLTHQAIGRLVCACSGTALLIQFVPAVAAVPFALLFTELVMLAWLARSMRAPPLSEVTR